MPSLNRATEKDEMELFVSHQPKYKRNKKCKRNSALLYSSPPSDQLIPFQLKMPIPSLVLIHLEKALNMLSIC